MFTNAKLILKWHNMYLKSKLLTLAYKTQYETVSAYLS